jgi:hypothetical protein
MQQPVQLPYTNACLQMLLVTSKFKATAGAKQ